MILKHPVSTEKSVKLIQAENKLVFEVDIKASKQAIREEVERLFAVKVVRINTLITPDATKRAILTLSPQTPAIDVATKLGLM